MQRVIRVTQTCRFKAGDTLGLQPTQAGTRLAFDWNAERQDSVAMTWEIRCNGEAGNLLPKSCIDYFQELADLRFGNFYH